MISDAQAGIYSTKSSLIFWKGISTVFKITVEIPFNSNGEKTASHNENDLQRNPFFTHIRK